MTALLVDHRGNSRVFPLGGLQIYQVSGDGAVTDIMRGKPAGNLRFEKSEVFRILAETAHVEAAALPLVDLMAPPPPKPKKKWTPEKLAELAAYRATHTMPETAATFGISKQRIRQLLPRAKQKPSPFPGVIHRSK